MREGSIAGNAVLDELPDEEVQPGATAQRWQRPEPADNPFNAWYVRTEIPGAGGGVLGGRGVAIKDNIFVAGVPLMDGRALPPRVCAPDPAA